MKWTIREAIDVYFKAKSVFKLGARTIRAGEPVLIFDTVKTSTLEVGADISYVTGGRGNARLLAFEGDKTLAFSFEDALLSNEGLAILAGADLIPARNSNLHGSHPDARSIVSHFTEKFSVPVNNMVDNDKTNTFADDATLYPPAGRTALTGANVVGIKEYDKAKETGTGAASAYSYFKDYSPRGGLLNVWLTKKPYVGQNASIYVMLLDDYGEMSGAPLEVSLTNDDTDNRKSYLAKWKTGDFFVAFNKAGKPIGDPTVLIKKSNSAPLQNGTYSASDGAVDSVARKLGTILAGHPKYEVVATTPNTTTNAGFTGMYFGYFNEVDAWADPTAVGNSDVKQDAAAFDDNVAYYVDLASAAKNWSSGWGPIEFYIREITASNYGAGFQAAGSALSCQALKPGKTATDRNGYAYLLAPSGGVAQPKCFKEGSQFVYKVNVPSVMYQDMVLIDYYVEYRHNATQISILPDKFGPYMYVEGSSLVRRQSDGMDIPVEFVIPKLKITTGITLTLQSTGDPSTFNFQGDALTGRAA